MLSAPHQVCRLIEHISTGKISKKITAAVFLDTEKAYDNVWIFGLIFKLINYNPLYLIKLIYYYLLNKNFYVRDKGKLSSNYFARFGVPQCSLISDKLFNLIINDIASYLHTFLVKYADDTCVFALNHNRRYAVIAITGALKIMSVWFLK